MEWSNVLQIALLVIGIIAIVLKIPDPELKAIKDFVMSAVKAAEMLFPKPQSGQLKKQEAMLVVKNRYAHLPDDVIDTYVEAAVYDLKRGELS